MQSAVVKKVKESPPRARPVADGTLHGAPHPMHQDLLTRWSAPTAPERKLAIPARSAIAIVAACLAWGLVISAVWAIARLV